MTGDYAVELFVRDAPMDREAVRFHMFKDNYALARNAKFVGNLVRAAKQHPDVFGSVRDLVVDDEDYELEEAMYDEDDQIEICPHCGTTMY